MQDPTCVFRRRILPARTRRRHEWWTTHFVARPRTGPAMLLQRPGSFRQTAAAAPPLDPSRRVRDGPRVASATMPARSRGRWWWPVGASFPAATALSGRRRRSTPAPRQPVPVPPRPAAPRDVQPQPGRSGRVPGASLSPGDRVESLVDHGVAPTPPLCHVPVHHVPPFRHRPEGQDPVERSVEQATRRVQVRLGPAASAAD